MRNILCMWFGHKPPVYSKRGWYSPGNEYGKLKGDYQDGVGRRHSCVHGECARCGTDFIMARVHLPSITNGEGLKDAAKAIRELESSMDNLESMNVEQAD